jgi:hypothetical protein
MTRFPKIANCACKANIKTAIKRIRNKDQPCVTGRVVATFSFGFWVGLMQPRYHPDLWSSHLRVAFPYLPADKSYSDIAASAKRVADLRNRISHHEPILGMDLSNEFRVAMELLGWLCPRKAEWLRPACRVHQILRQKP